jgi:hypothetical protein
MRYVKVLKGSSLIFPPQGTILCDFYRFLSQDGFLYVQYSGESTFG